VRVLLVFCHPVEDSYNAALHRVAGAALERAGHEVDDLDLYGERFDPVLSREERLSYHDLAVNRRPVQGYVDRLLRADALVFCFPIWSYGPPAMLKGFFDRVFLPGVSFHLQDGRIRPGLTHIRKLAAIVSYGQPRWLAWLAGDPPRKLITRYLRLSTGRATKVTYLAHYGMNLSTDTTRRRFLARVAHEMATF
jgi:putative NADPH-quinone reductase